MLAIGSIVIRVRDLTVQSHFWCEALNLVERDRASEDFRLLQPVSGLGPNISLDKHFSENSLPPRFHLDLYTTNQSLEVDRLINIGAKRVDWSNQPQNADYVILEDPEGNRFCVIQM